MFGRRKISENLSPFEKLSNFRDIGGLNTLTGRVMKAGLVYRSDELSRLTVGDVARLRGYGIRLICDLRSPKEVRRQPARRLSGEAVRVVNIPLLDPVTHEVSRKALLGFLIGADGADRFHEFSRNYYHHLAFEQTSRVGEVIRLLAEEENLPALIHCSAGKDRTGFVAALIQLLAGVPYEQAREEYLKTNDYFRPRVDRFIQVMRVFTLRQISTERMRLVMMAHGEHLDRVHGGILSRYGSMEGYLRDACGVDAAALRRFQARLLE